MSIFKRAVRKVLNESYSYEYTVDGAPDYFDIYKGDEVVGCCEYTDEDAVPFVICNGKMYIGKFGYGHPSCNEPDNAEEYDDFIEGRLWIKVPSSCNGNEDFDEYYPENPYEQNDDETYFPYSVLTFWSGDEEKLVNKELIEKLLSKYGVDKSEVLVASFSKDDYSSMYSYDEWSFEVEKANERQKKARAIHLMNAEDKHDATSDFRSNRDRLIGQKLTDKNGVEMPLAKYYSMIRSESKKSKNAINETLSPMVYHFTSLFKLYSIVDSNSLKFSETERTYGDRDLHDILSDNDKYGYFLSTTRQRNSNVGYQHYLDCNVRITLNSRAFNNNFHSRPVDFFYEKGKPSSKQYYSNGSATEKEIIHQHQVESEDRIFSENEYLDNADKYILRIDILFTKDLLTSKGYVSMLDDIVHSYLKDKIFVYDNKKDFDFQTNNTVNVEELLQ